MPFLANHPLFISSTYRTGWVEQWGSVVWGFMSCQVDDGAVVCHKGSRQREQGVFHPKALLRGLLKDKQHAFVLRHLFAPHQADLALLGGLRQLGVYLVHASRQLDALELYLRLLLGRYASGVAM